MLELTTFFLTTNTDNQGFFSVQHGLVMDVLGQGWAIYGILVSVRHINGNWHTLELSNKVDNRFWWNDTHVEGFIASPDFFERPVQIVVFAQYQSGPVPGIVGDLL